MQEYKQCPTCYTRNDPSNLSCQKCEKDLWDVLVTSTKALHADDTISLPLPPPTDDYQDSPPPYIPSQPPVVSGPRRKKWFIIFGILIAILLIFPSLFLIINRTPHKPQVTGNSLSPTAEVTPSLPSTPGVIPWQGQNIGVNDGTFAPFDVGRPTQSLKQQAAIELKNGNSQEAISLWQQALSIQSNDVETLIYLEDQRVLTAGKPYITLVAGVAFTPSNTQYEGELQGIYVAQHEFNAGNHPFSLRILIANSGRNVSDTAAVATQIMHIAQKDTTIVGVIGWLNSSNTQNALNILASAKLTIISPQASSDYLTGISHYFFRVVAPNKVQAQAAAKFMKNILSVKNPVVFLDHKDLYSENLAHDFENTFAAGVQWHEESFTTDNNSNFASLIKDALKYHPDAFYFTSPSSADAGRFQDALPTAGPTLPAMAGDGGYAIHKNGINRWYLTEYAYHGESNLPVAAQFAQEYTADFDPGPHPQQPAGFYGYSLPDDHSMLAYDATSVALTALEMAEASGKTTLTPQVLADTLPLITGAHTFQGVSGQIAFGSDHDPVNKAIVILRASASGYKLYNVQGCFVKGCL